MRAYDIDLEEASTDYQLYVAGDVPKNKQLETVDDPASWARRYALPLLVYSRELRERNRRLELQIAALNNAERLP